jgi:hypothetical protein
VPIVCVVERQPNLIRTPHTHTHLHTHTHTHPPLTHPHTHHSHIHYSTVDGEHSQALGSTILLLLLFLLLFLLLLLLLLLLHCSSKKIVELLGPRLKSRRLYCSEVYFTNQHTNSFPAPRQAQLNQSLFHLFPVGVPVWCWWSR